MKKLICLLLTAVILYAEPKPFKNVIMMIPDGMSQGGLTLTRWVNGGNPLTLDELACGMVRTYCATTPITDSAPAATAMATGFKSGAGVISCLPVKNVMPGLAQFDSSEALRPVATVLEAAKLKNKAVGLVSTCEIMHATPAAFASHSPSRKNYNFLSEQILYNNPDVVLGGGYDYYTPEQRGDKEDLIAEIKNSGYQLIRTPQELKQTVKGKVFGLFTPDAMSNDLDRDPAKEPSLAEMTAKAIELLKQDQDGFFLMVEGSKIDWAAHANEPVGMVSEINAFDRAVKSALDFAKADGNTAILICSDHGNSGITIGNRETDYDQTQLSAFIDPFKKATRTAEGVESLINADRSNIKEVISKYYGISDLNDTTEVPLIKNAKPGSLSYIIGPMFAIRSQLGFTTNGHTGEDLVLYSYSPKDPLHGTIQNTDVAKQLAKWLDLDLAHATSLLFQDAQKEFTSRGAQVSTDSSNEKNPVLVVKKDGREILFPANKNYALTGGKKTEFNGVTVYNGKKWFVSQKALEMVK